MAARLPRFARSMASQALMSMAPAARYPSRRAPAVMLVPGLCCPPSALNRLGLELARLGYDVHVPRPFPYFYGLLANTGPVELSVSTLLGDLERLAVHEGVREITLVGHSLGGVIALLTTMRAKRAVRSLPRLLGVVLLASPVGGTPWASLLAPLVPACRDIERDAELLPKVRARAARDVLLVISAGEDLVVPRASQEAIAADTVCFSDFQHADFYLGSPERIAKTARAISEVLPPER